MNTNTIEDVQTQAAVFGSTRRTTRAHPEPALRSRARALRGDMGDAFNAHPDAFVPEDPYLEFTPNAMSGLARRCVAEAQAVSETDENAARPLYLLALDLQQLALELQQDDLAQSTRRLGDCADGLARLRTVPTSGDLLDSACQELVSRCDFGRAVLSRVEDGMWIPSSAFFRDADVSWFADFVNQGIPLHGSTPEARMLTERRPAVVYDTARTTVHQEIIVESGQSKSYAVAPLMAGGSVVGLIHADHFPTTRQATEADRDVLWAFADGFTRIHERTVLMERVQAQRAQVEQVVGSALQGMAHQQADAVSHSAFVSARAESLADLTAREIQVMHLMVAGATNRSIATRLVIAEDTVKSHVKQILRKLGVTNRAQAIACAAGTAVA